MASENIDNSNYLLFAIKAYDRPGAITSEFKEDLKRIKYAKRLMRRYSISGELKEQLLLNHIIIIYNVFGVPAATRLLFLKIDPNDYPVLKTILLFLKYMPNMIYGINGKNIISSDISLNIELANRLRVTYR